MNHSESSLRELGQYFLDNYAQTIENAMTEMSELERYRDVSGVPIESYLWPIYRRLEQLDSLTENLRKHLQQNHD